MTRRTKIFCTIGPASDSPEVLDQLIEAGMAVARIALAHSSVEEGLARMQRIREASARTQRPVGVLVDLPGPKTRISSVDPAGVHLVVGQTVELRPGSQPTTGDTIYVEYDGLLNDLHPGDQLPFGDSSIVVRVDSKDHEALKAQVISGGVLRGRSSVHIPSDRLSTRTPTDDDLGMLDPFLDAGVDMVALSFVRSGSDVRRLGTEPFPRGPLIVSKVENRAAIENLDGIIAESGAIMVARGDLGAECSLAELPHLQKEIIERCIAGGLPVVTATQMLETMVHTATPTRAEASDIANAVFDGSSALLLASETAIGAHPVKAVETMAEIAELADERFDTNAWADRLESLHLREPTITDAMTSAAARACETLDIEAVIAITATGSAVRSMARFRPRAALLGFSDNEVTRRQLTSSWGTTPLALTSGGSYEDRVAEAVETAKSMGLVHAGALVGVLAHIDATNDATDSFRVLRVR